MGMYQFKLFRSINTRYSRYYYGLFSLFRCSGTLAHYEGEVNGASLSWCGHYLASWATDASAQVWDLRHTSEPLHVLRHDAEVSRVIPKLRRVHC